MLFLLIKFFYGARNLKQIRCLVLETQSHPSWRKPGGPTESQCKLTKYLDQMHNLEESEASLHTRDPQQKLSPLPSKKTHLIFYMKSFPI